MQIPRGHFSTKSYITIAAFYPFRYSAEVLLRKNNNNKYYPYLGGGNVDSLVSLPLRSVKFGFQIMFVAKLSEHLYLMLYEVLRMFGDCLICNGKYILISYSSCRHQSGSQDFQVSQKMATTYIPQSLVSGADLRTRRENGRSCSPPISRALRRISKAVVQVGDIRYPFSGTDRFCERSKTPTSFVVSRDLVHLKFRPKLGN